MKPFLLLQHRSYENQVVFLICFLGLLRIMISIIMDSINPVISIPEILTDVSLLILFTIVFLWIFFRPLTTDVHFSFGLLIILLLSLNFIQFGGVMGGTEFNFYSGLFFIGMTYSGRTLYALLCIQLLILLGMLWIGFTHHPLQQYLYIRLVADHTDFIFSLLVISVIAFFLRDTTEREIKKVHKMSKVLVRNTQKIRNQHIELIEQDTDLKAAHHRLETEINNRTLEVQNQNHAIEQFIHYSTNALSAPQKRLTEEIESFSGNTVLHQLLIVSCTELNVVLDTIRETIGAKENLDREKLKHQ